MHKSTLALLRAMGDRSWSMVEIIELASRHDQPQRARATRLAWVHAMINRGWLVWDDPTLPPRRNTVRVVDIQQVQDSTLKPKVPKTPKAPKATLTQRIQTDPDLGVVSDQVLADRHGVSRQLINHVRRALPLPNGGRPVVPQKVWTLPADAGLGQHPDTVIAQTHGVPIKAVRNLRRQAGLPRWARVTPRQDLLKVMGSESWTLTEIARKAYPDRAHAVQRASNNLRILEQLGLVVHEGRLWRRK